MCVIQCDRCGRCWMPNGLGATMMAASPATSVPAGAVAQPAPGPNSPPSEPPFGTVTKTKAPPPGLLPPGENPKKAPPPKCGEQRPKKAPPPVLSDSGVRMQEGVLPMPTTGGAPQSLERQPPPQQQERQQPTTGAADWPAWTDVETQLSKGKPAAPQPLDGTQPTAIIPWKASPVPHPGGPQLPLPSYPPTKRPPSVKPPPVLATMPEQRSAPTGALADQRADVNRGGTQQPPIPVTTQEIHEDLPPGPGPPTDNSDSHSDMSDAQRSWNNSPRTRQHLLNEYGDWFIAQFDETSVYATENFIEKLNLESRRRPRRSLDMKLVDMQYQDRQWHLTYEWEGYRMTSSLTSSYSTHFETYVYPAEASGLPTRGAIASRPLCPRRARHTEYFPSAVERLAIWGFAMVGNLIPTPWRGIPHRPPFWHNLGSTFKAAPQGADYLNHWYNADVAQEADQVAPGEVTREVQCTV